MITGSVASAYDEVPWINELCQLIRKLHPMNIKLVGICFGHQVIAHALGSKVERNPRGWGLGQKTFPLNPSAKEYLNSLVGGANPKTPFPLLDTLAMYYIHQDHVPVVPPGFEEMGGSPSHAPVLGYFNRTNILTYQGHPEFTKPMVEECVDNIWTNPPTYLNKEHVLASLDLQVDEAFIAISIIAFIKNKPTQ
uniref:Glutamine amidotransferase domain-containing protein n=1 Tax=Arcella intermedia TaxID=1963864 RepID=A0A6B2LJT7_9EUKA